MRLTVDGRERTKRPRHHVAFHRSINHLALYYLRVAATAGFCCRFDPLLRSRPTSGALTLREAAQDEWKSAGQEAGDGRHDQRPAGHVVIEQGMDVLEHSCQCNDAGQQADDAEQGEGDEGPGPVVRFHGSFREEWISASWISLR